MEIDKSRGIERSNNIGRRIGPHGVECLIDHAKAQVGLDRLAGGIDCKHVEAGGFLRLILTLVRRGRKDLWRNS